jgi:uncharacterized protein
MLIHPQLKKIHETSIDMANMDVDSYYLDKYAYLKRNGFFSERKFVNLESEIDEPTVKDGIAQTPQIVFEVTDRCNLKCSYCAQGELYESFNNKAGEINIHSAIKLLKYIFNLVSCNKKSKLGIAFYGGEPLLNIKFIKQVVNIIPQLNVEKQIDIIYLMTTNATLLYRHIDFLVENKFKLLISLDGNEENHSYRIFVDKNNSHRKVIENIDKIRVKYPEYFASNIDFNAVLHNRNSVKEIYEFIYTRYGKIPRISELNMRYNKPDEAAVLDEMFHSKQKSETEYNKEYANQLIHTELSMYNELINFLKYLSVNYYVSNITDILHNEEKNFPTNTCFPFSRKTFLTNRNKILTCERIGNNYILGIIEKDVEIDIQNISQQYKYYYENLKKVCQYCYAYRFCGLCMFQIKNFDKLENGRFVCDSFYDQKKFQTKLYHIFSFLEKNPSDFFEILKNLVIEQ